MCLIHFTAKLRKLNKYRLEKDLKTQLTSIEGKLDSFILENDRYKNANCDIKLVQDYEDLYDRSLSEKEIIKKSKKIRD